MFSALLQTAPAVQSRGLIGRQGNAGMRPERRFKPGMDGGLTAAILVSPPLHLRTVGILSKQWGPPQNFGLRTHFVDNLILRECDCLPVGQNSITKLTPE